VRVVHLTCALFWNLFLLDLNGDLVGGLKGILGEDSNVYKVYYVLVH
jgi:hypothetical protein